MTKSLRSIKSFLFTLLVPLIYFFNLVIIWKTQTTNLQLEDQVLGASTSLFFLIKQLFLLLLVFVGLLLWFTGYLFIGGSFSTTPQARKIVNKGPYRFLRHPIYIGIALTFIGLSLITKSKAGLCYALFLVLPLNFLRSKNEEKVLKEVFGDRYETYKQKTLF